MHRSNFRVLLACLLTSFVMGCQPESSVVITPATTSISDTTVTTTAPDGTTTVTRQRKGDAKGPGGEAQGAKSQLNGDGKPAGIDLGGNDKAPRSDGGGGSLTGLSFAEANIGSPFVWASLILLLGAVGLVYFGMPGIAVYCLGASILCGVAAFYPMVFVWGGLAMLVGGAGYLAYTGHLGNRAKEALRATVAGIENAGTTASEAVKAEVAKHADTNDLKTIDAVKRADNL